MHWLRNIGLVIIGLALGAGLGLLLGWVVWPTEYTDATPVILQEGYRRDYIVMTAAAYAADSDLTVATERIDALGVNGRDHLFAVTIDAILSGGDEQDIRQLVQLATALGLSSPAMDPYLREPAP
jgi:hypothetical protein